MAVAEYRNKHTGVLIRLEDGALFVPDPLDWDLVAGVPRVVAEAADTVVSEDVVVSAAQPVEETTPATGEGFPAGEPTAAWTLKQLKAYATAQGLDVDGFNRKADVLAALS